MRTSSFRSASNKRKAREARSEAPIGCDNVDRPPRIDDPADQPLRQAVENKVVGLDGLQAARLAIVQLFGRILRLQETLVETFGGQPFLPNLSPTCPANRRRFNTYISEFTKLSRLLGYALDLWILTCGMKREDDWTPILVADINRRALVEAYRQNLNQNAAANAKSAPGEGPHASAGKTDRVPVTPIDIGRSGSSAANKSQDVKRAQGFVRVGQKGGQDIISAKQSH
jgi:hypothetical protein